MHAREAMRQVQAAIGKPHGMCYVASEALYHLLGGKAAGYVPVVIQHEGGSHWYLRDANGRVLDATARQFKTRVPYAEGRGCGFLTKAPSKRARAILEAIGRRQSDDGSKHGD